MCFINPVELNFLLLMDCILSPKICQLEICLLYVCFYFCISEPFLKVCCSNLTFQHSAVQTEEVRYICHTCGLNSRVDVGSRERQYIGSETSQYTADNIHVGLGKSSSFVGTYLQKDKQTGEATEIVAGRLNS